MRNFLIKGKFFWVVTSYSVVQHGPLKLWYPTMKVHDITTEDSKVSMDETAC